VLVVMTIGAALLGGSCMMCVCVGSRSHTTVPAEPGATRSTAAPGATRSTAAPGAMAICAKLAARGVVSDCEPETDLPKDPKDTASFSTPTNMGGFIMHYPDDASWREATREDLGVQEWRAPKARIKVLPLDVPEPPALAQALRDVLTEAQKGTAPIHLLDKPVPGGAQGGGATCADGTPASCTGRGCCSHHGGLGGGHHRRR
jgi:hypothetical protein